MHVRWESNRFVRSVNAVNLIVRKYLDLNGVIARYINMNKQVEQFITPFAPLATISLGQGKLYNDQKPQFCR